MDILWISEDSAVLDLSPVLLQETESPVCPKEVGLPVKPLFIGGILCGIYPVVKGVLRKPVFKEEIHILQGRIAVGPVRYRIVRRRQLPHGEIIRGRGIIACQGVVRGNIEEIGAVGVRHRRHGLIRIVEYSLGHFRHIPYIFLIPVVSRFLLPHAFA